ncbi:hypothetical protein AGR1C_Lc10172 [Agrobacterium fabacearum TT111]|nr:hypothetical protein AGR1C_Lc10172 [Agrobacterium fabacearum TT111]
MDWPLEGPRPDYAGLAPQGHSPQPLRLLRRAQKNERTSAAPMAVAEAAYQNTRIISSEGAGAEEVGADADMHSERGLGLH